MLSDILLENELQSLGPFLEHQVTVQYSSQTICRTGIFPGGMRHWGSWRGITKSERGSAIWKIFLFAYHLLKLSFSQGFQSVLKEVIKTIQILFINASGSRR